MTGSAAGRRSSEIGGGELKLTEEETRQVQPTGRGPEGPPGAGISAWHGDAGAGDLGAELPHFRDRITGPEPGQFGLDLSRLGDGVRGERPHALLGEQALTVAARQRRQQRLA